MAATGTSVSVDQSGFGWSAVLNHTGTDATTQSRTYTTSYYNPTTGKRERKTVTTRDATVTITHSGYHGGFYYGSREWNYVSGTYSLSTSYRGTTQEYACSINLYGTDYKSFGKYWPANTWIDCGSSTLYFPEANLFDSNNPNDSYVDIYFSVQSHDPNNLIFWNAGDGGVVYFNTTVQGVGYLSRIYINNPPTYTLGNITNDTDGRIYAGYTTVTLPISNLSAKCGGSISNAVLTINNQTDSRTTNGNFTIALDTPGIFTPSVTVTDSRNQITTKTLSDIVVLPYVYPSITYDTDRVKPDTTLDDEGSCILVKATYTYTSDVETLTAPTVVVKDSSNNTVSVITKWFDNYDTETEKFVFNFSAVTNPSGNPNTNGYYELSNNVYVLSTDTSVVSGKTYYEIDDEVDWTDTSDWESPKKLSALIYGFTDIQHSYQLSITPSDTTHSGTANIQSVASAYYTVDFYAGGHGVAFGKAAVGEGFECGMPATFNNDIKLTIDENAAPGTLDGNLYAALVARGWITPSS